MSSEDLCDEIAINIGAIFKTMAPGVTSDCCIYRVARRFHKLKDEVYTPRVISIGPFHHGRPEMQFMERQKERFLFQFINRTKLSLKSLVTFVKDSEERIRSCYAETIDLRNKDFVKMILLDGSFIIEYFLKCRSEIGAEMDVILSNPRHNINIRSDLILLENQLPFWFIENLYNLSPSIKDDENIHFTELACDYFRCFNRKISPKNDILHFTDLVRILELPFNSRKESTHYLNFRKGLSCSATDLDTAGVKFKVNNSKCLFDIRFTTNDRVLSFPNFEIHNETERLYKNLMALEQYHYPYQTYICDYIILMDTLINTIKDLEILVKKGIVTNWLGGQDEVVTLIKNLGREILFSASDSDCRKVSEDLMEYYEKPPIYSSSSLIYCVSDWYKWKSNLKEDYFSTPWKIVSIIAAAILLVLTFIQTVNSF